MAEIEDVLKNLSEQLRELHKELIKILKEGKSLQNHVLVKKGFVVHSFSLNYNALDPGKLPKILGELEIVVSKEIELQKYLSGMSEELITLENDYHSISKKRLHASLIYKFLKDLFYYSRLMITRVRQLSEILAGKKRLHEKSLPKNTEIFFASFENVGVKVIRSIRLIEQIVQKIITFEKESYYPNPKTYGRIMSSVEYKKMIDDKRLSSRQDPTPVFDAPRQVMEKMKRMTNDQLKGYFKSIGVRSFDNLVFFRTSLKPINHDRPVPQSNGLREYKFPKGIEIELLEAA